MQRAERRLVAIQKKIKHYKLEKNLSKIDLLNKLCDNGIKKRRNGAIIFGIFTVITLIALVAKYQTPEVSIDKIHSCRV